VEKVHTLSVGPPENMASDMTRTALGVQCSGANFRQQIEEARALSTYPITPCRWSHYHDYLATNLKIRSCLITNRMLTPSIVKRIIKQVTSPAI